MNLKIEKRVCKLYPEYVEEVAGLSVEQLDARLAALAKGLEAVDEAKENDEELQRLSEEYKNASDAYTDAKKASRLKSRYVIGLIRDKGGK